MSAIGLLPRSAAAPAAKMFISRHADYRREDFVFRRMQSHALREMPWENRSKPLKSWDRLVYSGLAAAMAGVALELLR